MGRSGERFKEVRSTVVVREGFLEEVTFELRALSEMYREVPGLRKSLQSLAVRPPPQINHPR